MASSLRAQHAQTIAEAGEQIGNAITSVADTYNKSQYVKFQKEVENITAEAELKAVNQIPDKQEEIYNSALASIDSLANKYGGYVKYRYTNEQQGELKNSYKLSLAKTKATAEAGLSYVDYNQYTELEVSSGKSFTEVVQDLNKYTEDTGILEISSLQGKVQDGYTTAFNKIDSIVVARGKDYYTTHSADGTYNEEEMIKYVFEGVPTDASQDLYVSSSRMTTLEYQVKAQINTLKNQRQQSASDNVDTILSQARLQANQEGKTLSAQDEWELIKDVATYEDKNGNIQIKEEYIPATLSMVQNLNKNQALFQAQTEVASFAQKTPESVQADVQDIANELRGVKTTKLTEEATAPVVSPTKKGKYGTGVVEEIDLSQEQASYDWLSENNLVSATYTSDGSINWDGVRTDTVQTYGSEETFYAPVVDKLCEKYGFTSEDAKEGVAIYVNSLAENGFFANPNTVAILTTAQNTMWAVNDTASANSWKDYYTGLKHRYGYTDAQLNKAGIYENAPWLEAQNNPSFSDALTKATNQVMEQLGFAESSSNDSSTKTLIQSVKTSVSDELYRAYQELLADGKNVSLSSISSELYDRIPDIVKNQTDYQTSKWFEAFWKTSSSETLDNGSTIADVMTSYYTDNSSVYKRYFNGEIASVADATVNYTDKNSTKKDKTEIYNSIANEVYHCSFEELSGTQKQTVAFNVGYAEYRKALTSLCEDTFGVSGLAQVEVQGVGLGLVRDDGVIYFADANSVTQNQWKISRITDKRVLNAILNNDPTVNPVSAVTLDMMPTPKSFDSEGKNVDSFKYENTNNQYESVKKGIKEIDNLYTDSELAEANKQKLYEYYSVKSPLYIQLESIYSGFGLAQVEDTGIEETKRRIEAEKQYNPTTNKTANKKTAQTKALRTFLKSNGVEDQEIERIIEQQNK